MAKQHHSLPVFIIKNFASADAADLVPHVPGLKERYSRLMMNRSKSRTWPVCVQVKAGGQRKYEFTVNKAENICFKDNLYSIPIYPDNLRNGILKLLFEGLTTEKITKAPSNAEAISTLENYGSKPLRFDVLEDFIARKVDDPAARIFSNLMNGAIPGEADLDIMATFITVAMCRTPGWIDLNYPGAREEIIRIYNKVDPILLRPEHKMIADIIFSHQGKILWDTCIHVMLMDLIRKKSVFHHDVVKFVLLKSPEGVRFITCDNPARQYNIDRVSLMDVDPLPGFKIQNTVCTYPIGPRHCILLTTKTDFPKFSTRQASIPLVQAINAALLKLAVKYVIYPSPDTRGLFPCKVNPRFSRPWKERNLTFRAKQKRLKM